MMRRDIRRRLSLSILAFAGTAACTAGEAPAPPEGPAPEEAEGPVYSPFVVTVDGAAPYRSITFKQVGSLVSDVDRAVLFEALAESLVLELQGETHEFVSHMSYDPSVAQPGAHLACGAAQIYVDFWERSGAEPGFGFSLWSGCSEDDRFALEDVEAGSEGEITAWIEPLSRGIAAALRRAGSTGCYQRSC